MAKTATWDILRINRLPHIDREAADDDILRFVANRISEARRDGYKKIIVAGYSRGGWLALSAATLPDVDAAIGLAPGTAGINRQALERTRDVLAHKLAGARTKRVAAFFFDGDPREDVSERRAAAIRRGLEKSGSTFIVVDRPPDLQGHSAAPGVSPEDTGIVSCSSFRAPTGRPARFNALLQAAMRWARKSAFPHRVLPRDWRQMRTRRLRPIWVAGKATTTMAPI
jgi:dienelactone hydrolase